MGWFKRKRRTVVSYDMLDLEEAVRCLESNCAEEIKRLWAKILEVKEEMRDIDARLTRLENAFYGRKG